MKTDLAPSFALLRARQLLSFRPGREAGDVWSLANLAGRLVEISEETASGALTFVCGLIAEAQTRKEPVGWIAGASTIFYPPDLARNGLDLAGIVVVRGRGGRGALQAGDWLLRSGAFGLVVFDWGTGGRIAEGFLGRLLRLAEEHATAVIFLSRKNEREASVGALVSLRAVVRRNEKDLGGCEVHSIKDKRAGFHPTQRILFDGPPGLS